ncbi:MAG: hypothetical protein GY845_22495 [Planctomycetes bacterium]|nr:hypothetical protein [Planctomycetota bacterium]
MKTNKVLLPLSFCCCLFLLINGCHSEKVPDLAKFNSYLKTQQNTFKQQMEQVETQYPMVALAFYMQEAAIGEHPFDYLAESVESLTGSSVVSKEHDIRFRLCLNGLYRGFARAQNSEDVSGTIKRFQGCLKREGEVPVDQ